MPLDGSFLACLRHELEAMVDCHIDKIHIPSKSEFVFGVRGKGFNKKLFISLSPESPRVSFTSATFENPSNPPMFCMLLRKHLSSGRIINIEGFGAERIINFKVLSTNDMGDRVTNTLVLEFFGAKTNLILLDSQGRIIDSARRSDIESSDRIIQPGAIYTPPKNTGKTDLLTGDLITAAKSILSIDHQKLCDSILKNIAGVSPLICREISYNLTGDVDTICKDIAESHLLKQLENIKSVVLEGGKPYMLYKEGTPKDYSFLEIHQYENHYINKPVESFSELLEEFFCEKERIKRLENSKSDLVKRVKNLITRNERKLNYRKEELKQTSQRESLRIYGELIKANIYRIDKSADKIVVENYYDPNCELVEIPLNTALSPANNAAKYFKDYKKACTAAATLGQLINECETELEYLDSVLFELFSADSAAEINEIRSELLSGGYISSCQNKRQAKIDSKPYTFSKNGFEIMVGKNNLQNDHLTTKIAGKGDLWFHTKNIHGSHVILFTNGKEPDEDTMLYAANLAAYYSKAKNSNQVPVDYTPVKFVKKPNGSKPGMVIYTTNKTIFANPGDLKL